jgi:hypothetical protein
MIEILKSVEMNGELAQYLHTNHSVEMFIKTWTDSLSKDELDLVDHQEMILGLDFIHYQLKGSVKVQSYGLLEEWGSAATLLCKVIKTGPFSGHILSLKVSNASIFEVCIIYRKGALDGNHK